MSIKQLPFALTILGAMAALYQPQAVAGSPGDVNVVASFNYQALITDGSGNPITNATNLTFEFKILSPNQQCLLYDEIQTGISSDSTGLVSLNVGSLTTPPNNRVPGVDPGFTMSNIIANNPGTTFPVSSYCASPYTPATGDARLLRVIVTQPLGVPITLSPDVVLGSVPQAYVADTLQGLGPSNFVQVTGGGTNDVSQANVEALVGGTDISSSNLHNHDTHNNAIYARLGAPNSFTGNLDTTGTVGIGTTSAATGATLDVEGVDPTLRIGGTASSGQPLTLAFYGTGSTPNASITSVDNSGTLSFATNNIQAMSINSSQQVTFSSSVGLGGTLGLVQLSNVQDTGLTGTLVLSNQGTMWENSTNRVLRYWDGLTAQTIANTNDVVNTVNLSPPLMNTGSSTFPNISLPPATNIQSGYLTSTDWITFNNDRVNKAGDIMTGTLTLPANGLVAGTSQLVLNSGNVGIGTTAPTGQLQVVTATAATTGQIIQGAAGQTNDLTDWENSSGTVMSYVDAGGKFHGDGSDLTNLPGSGSQWTTSGSNIYNSNAGNVGIGTTNPQAPLDVNGAIYVKGQLGIWEDNGANTAVGQNSLGNANPSGNNNTAVGQAALGGNTGGSNVAVGADALLAISGGQGNVAVGYATMDSTGSGSFNTAIGYLAGEGGTLNGSSNIMLGSQVGMGMTLSGSNNILIGTNNTVLTPLSTTNNFLNIGNVIFATGMTGTLAAPAGNVGIGTTNPGAKLDVNGALRLDGSTGGYLAFQAPATVGTSVTWTLPNGDGSGGQVLSTSGTGTLSWITPSGGSVTNVTATLPLTSSMGATPNIALPLATTSQSGYLASSDWAMFNSKANSFATGNLTETASDVLTLAGNYGSVIGTGVTVQVKQAGSTQDGFLSSSDWNTFSGKQNALGYVPVNKAGDSMTGTLTMQAPVTISGANPLNFGTWTTGTRPGAPVAGTTGFNIATNQLESYDGTMWVSGGAGSVTSITASIPLVVSGTTTPNVSLPQATTSQSGYLASSDWNTFNGKVSKAGDGMTGPLTNNSNSPSTALAIFQTGSGYAATFTGGNVGIGTTTPGAFLHVLAPTPATTGSIIQGAAGQFNDLTDWENNVGAVLSYVDSSGEFHGNGAGLTGVSGTDSTKLPLAGGAMTGQLAINDIATNPFAVNTSQVVVTTNGNVGIGTAVPTAGLHISTNGAASTPAERLNGTWYTGGGTTNTKPQLLVEPTGATSSGWSAQGTGVGVNAVTGFNGRLLDLQVNGGSAFYVDHLGNVVIGNGGGRISGASGESLAGFDASTYVSHNAAVTSPDLNPIMQISNSEPLDSSMSFTGFSVANTSGNSQAAYFGAVASTGAVYSPALVFGQQTGPTSYSETMRLAGNGDVGIGTTAPAGQLQVVASTSSTTGQIIQGAAGQFSDLTDWANNAGTVLSYIDSGGKFHGDGSNLVNVPSGPWTTGGGNNIYNNNTGNVGIGTTAPVGILDVEGPGAAVFDNAGGVGIGTTNPNNATLNIVSSTPDGILVSGSESVGVMVQSASSAGVEATGTSYGVWGYTGTAAGRGVFGDATGAGYGIYGTSFGGTSGFFQTSGGSNLFPTLIIEAGTSQNGDLTDWDNSGGTAVTYIDNTGALYITNVGAANTAAVTKAYVSTAVGSYLPLAGGALTGPLNGTAISTTGNVGVGGVLNVSGVGNNSFGGKVGIGTTAPVGLLDVEGAGPIVLNTGSVGIGTNSPNYPLDIQNAVATTTMHVTNSNGGGGDVGISVATLGPGAQGLSVSPSGPVSVGVYVSAMAASSTGVYSQGSQYGVEGIANTPLSSGVFGINTSATNNGTGVYGMSTNGISAQFMTNGSNNASPTLQVEAGTSQTGPLIALNNEGPGSNAALLDALGNQTSTSINSNGFLGVGVASAAAYLELGGSNGTVPSLVVDSGTLLSSPKPGAIEFDGSDFYVTDSNQYRRSIAGVYVGETVGTYNGLGVGGYSGANTFCNAAVSGSHMCTADEMVRSVTLGISMPNGAWYSTGIAVSGSASADCGGWQSTGGVSAMAWVTNAGMVESCVNPFPIACCK